MVRQLVVFCRTCAREKDRERGLLMTNESEALSTTVGRSAGLCVGSAVVPCCLARERMRKRDSEGESVRESERVHGRKNENAPR